MRRLAVGGIGATVLLAEQLQWVDPRPPSRLIPAIALVAPY